MAYQGKDDDRQLLLTAEVEFDQYLDSDVVFWRLSGGKLPLCPGNLLLATLRLSMANDLLVSRAMQRLDGLKGKRFAAWKSKLESEIPVRLNQWRTYLEDMHDNGKIDKTFRYNVRARVILDLLLMELNTDSIQVNRELRLADELLVKITKPGEFIWEEELSEVFPMSRFPYLYVTGK